MLRWLEIFFRIFAHAYKITVYLLRGPNNQQHNPPTDTLVNGAAWQRRR